jgi:glutathione synthase/RimK-type ligase-like ATP-grasp enzyme
MRAVIVTNSPKKSTFAIPGVEVVQAKDYLISTRFSDARDLKVFNICRSYGYQTDGYYVSLLAAARGHKVYPSIRTIQETKSLSVVKIITEDFEELIQKSLKSIQSSKFSFNIYFGSSLAHKYNDLAQKIFKQFLAPLMRVDFVWKGNQWQIQNIQLISLNEIPNDHFPYALENAKKYFAGKMKHTRRKVSYSYDLAILVNENEKVPPSNKKAIDKFEWAGEKVGFNVDIIDKEDYDRISEFDALFIRETTNVNHHTFRFSQRAEADGLVVIDDPVSILKCTNKVYLAEVLNHYRIPAPRTLIINHDNKDQAIKILGYPTILKQPDSAFSQGVIKVVNREDFKRKVDDFLDKSDLVIAQEFVPTEFDWRVGIINNEPLYVCRYYMAKEHWQIVHWTSGSVREGRWDSVRIADAPPIVVKTALRASKIIGDGFYGVDLKMVGKKCIVIEVNDNPSVETGVEDAILKDELYLKIMRVMYDRVKKKKNGI